MGRPPKAKASGSPKKAKSAVVKQKRAKKDPNAPKRGKSAYMFWLADNRERLTKPGMSVIDVTKAAGVEWKKLKADDKVKFEKMAAEDKKRYEKESKKYKAAGSGSSGDEGTSSPKPSPKKAKGKK